MDEQKVTRAWKDAEFYEALTDEERHQIPASPSGYIEIDEDQLDVVRGGLYDATILVCPPSIGDTCLLATSGCC
jgi:mersacidin/lichenicidin family type 2 lantibiotic